MWLKQNNHLYRDVVIDETAAAVLPENGDVTPHLRHVRGNVGEINEPAPAAKQQSDSNIDTDADRDRDTFTPLTFNFSLRDEARATLSVQYPAMSSTPIDEFNTLFFVPAVFPTLFPDGKPCTKDDRPIKRTPRAYFMKLLGYKDLRFTRHPSFHFFALNVIQRWQAVATGNVFVKKNDLNNLTMDQLKQSIINNPSFLKRVMSYFSTIPGTDSFWFKRSGEFRTMVEQLGIPHLFFTLSFADHHKPHLIVLSGLGLDASAAQSSRIIRDPLIVDWFFELKVRAFHNTVMKHKETCLNVMRH